jgi:pyridoxine 5-phosphate synthase
VVANRLVVEGCVNQFKRAKMKVSLFIEASSDQIKASQDLGADAIEFHTGGYSLARGEERKKIAEHLFKAADSAHQLGLKIHAGHGLDYENVHGLLKMPHLEELNIGHSIVCRSVMVGLLQAVKEMKAIVSGAGSGAHP